MNIRGMKKNILLGIIIGSISFSLLACSKKEIKSVMDKDKIIVGLDDAFAPMGFKNESGEIVSESSAIEAMEKDMELYESFNGGEAITFEDNNQALMDLESGRIDAVVADEILVKYYIKLKGEDKFKVLTENFGSEEYGVGIRKGDIETVEAINNAFEEMKKDGKMSEISQKWFGEDITNN